MNTKIPLPYYAVIFTSFLDENTVGYEETAERMEQLARQQEGFLGMESAREKVGITVSYWKSEAAILAWKNNLEHTAARTLGRQQWYKNFQLRICKVERAYDFSR